LGPNGAGKTTTVKIMLREHVATSGTIESPYAPEDSVRGSRCIPVASWGSLYRGALLGVCPQHDEEHVHPLPRDDWTEPT
jgi:ABC-type multidrug transport system ATPase subunit